MVPIENEMPALTEWIDYQQSVSPEHDDASTGGLYANMRYVAGDDIALSQFKGRDTVVFSFIVSGNTTWSGSGEEFDKYASKMEAICQKYGGIPHWGKENYVQREELVGFYGEDTFERFQELRAEVDPNEVFLNDYLRERLLK
jgi:FAD/FMN-containing dehydrogenase